MCRSNAVFIYIRARKMWWKMKICLLYYLLYQSVWSYAGAGLVRKWPVYHWHLGLGWPPPRQCDAGQVQAVEELIGVSWAWGGLASSPTGWKQASFSPALYTFFFIFLFFSALSFLWCTFSLLAFICCPFILVTRIGQKWLAKNHVTV